MRAFPPNLKVLSNVRLGTFDSIVSVGITLVLILAIHQFVQNCGP